MNTMSTQPLPDYPPCQICYAAEYAAIDLGIGPLDDASVDRLDAIIELAGQPHNDDNGDPCFEEDDLSWIADLIAAVALDAIHDGRDAAANDRMNHLIDQVDAQWPGLSDGLVAAVQQVTYKAIYHTNNERNQGDV